MPWKITHGSRKGDKEDDGLLAPFALNSMVMSTDWHDPDYVRISVRLTVQCGSFRKCPLILISRCTEDTMSKGGLLLDIDLRAECLAYILMSLFCMKTLKDSTRDTLLYTSLLQLATWNSWSRMLCTEELGDELIYFLMMFADSIPTAIHHFIQALYLYTYLYL